MSLKTVYRLAVVLTKSQLRGYQRSSLLSKIFGDPRIILGLDSVLLTAFALIGYYATAVFLPIGVRDTIQGLESEALAGTPTAIAFSVILFGMVAEISQPVQSASTDLVYWLPISPGEYVGASAASMSYTYSFLLFAFLGLTLGPAIAYGIIPVWFTSAMLSFLSLLLGTCVVESLRSLTNRISSSFYKRSGRSGIFARLLLTVAVLVFFNLLFNGRIVVLILESVIQAVNTAWFVPLVWPSVAVIAASQFDTGLSILFGLLSFAFLITMYGLAVKLRTKYWVPVPVSIKLTARAYQPSGSSRYFPGIGQAERALLRKDLRSLTRRREMARFLAIPFVLIASIVFSLVPFGGRPIAGPGFISTIPLYIIPVAIFCNIVAMTSIGQEGSAIWNLYSAPITPKVLLKTKLIITLLLGVVFQVAMLAVLFLMLKLAIAELLLLLVLGAVMVLEESALGLYFGARFPDFRETVRSRYVTVWGSLIGTSLGLLLAVFTALPVFATILFRRRLTAEIVLSSLVIGLSVLYLSWRLGERQVGILLRNIRV